MSEATIRRSTGTPIARSETSSRSASVFDRIASFQPSLRSSASAAGTSAKTGHAGSDVPSAPLLAGRHLEARHDAPSSPGSPPSPRDRQGRARPGPRARAGGRGPAGRQRPHRATGGQRWRACRPASRPGCRSSRRWPIGPSSAESTSPGVAACSPMGSHDVLLESLRAAVGESHVLTDADVRASYETDWTRRWRGEALAVVRPASTEEVIAVLLACAEAGAAVIPQGGNTGLVGGSVPRAMSDGPQVVLSTLRLRELEPVEPLAGEVTVGAGVTLAALQAHVRGRRASDSASTSEPATRPPSAAWSPPTQAGSTCSATDRCARSCSASRRCSPTAASCGACRAWSRTTPAITCPRSWPAARGRWRSSRARICTLSRSRPRRAVALLGFASRWRTRSRWPATCAARCQTGRGRALLRRGHGAGPPPCRG